MSVTTGKTGLSLTTCFIKDIYRPTVNTVCPVCREYQNSLLLLLPHPIPGPWNSFITSLVFHSAFLGRPERQFRTGLCFARDVFFLFLFRHSFSEFPRPIAVKLCHMVGNWLNFTIQVQKISGAPPPQKNGAKNMRNFGQFLTTSEFDREYLGNGATYPKPERRKN